MKKIITFLGTLLVAGFAHALTGPFVQITTGTLQPNTTNGFYVSSGTILNANPVNLKSTGTWTIGGGTWNITGSTWAFTQSKVSGTIAIDNSTRTFVGGVFNGVRTDNSSTTYTGSNTVVGPTTFNGNISASSGTITSFTALSASMTYVTISTVNNNPAMNSHKFVGMAAGSGAGDSVRFEQLKVIQIVSATTSGAKTNTSATFAVFPATCTITPTSASNAIAVLITGPLASDTSGQITFASIARNGTNIGGTNGIQELSISSPFAAAPGSLFFYDAPATTSSTQYAPMIRTTGGVATFCAANTTCSTFCIELAP